MAKQGESLEDLDAEIARLEAELEALEDGLPASAAKKRKPGTRPAKPERKAEAPRKAGLKLSFGRRARSEDAADGDPGTGAPAPGPEAARPEADDEVDAAPRKGLLGKLRKPRLGKAATEEVAPDVEDEDADASPAIDDADAEPAPLPSPEDSEWTREGGVWKRVAPAAEPLKLRRVLDADGNVVTEEPATDEDLRAVRANGEAPTERKVLGFLKRRGR